MSRRSCRLISVLIREIFVEFYRLTNETIDLLSEEIGKMYTDLGCTKKDMLRAKLLMEEALIKYKMKFGEDIELYFRRYRIMSQTRFCLRVRAPSFDPFTMEEHPMAFMVQSMMINFDGSAPTWKFRNQENEIVFTVKKKAALTGLAKLIVSLLVFMIMGIAGRIFIPYGILTVLVNDYIQPLTDAYAGLFCVMAVLVTFFDIVLGIVHVGSISTASSIGRKIIRRFFVIIFIISALAAGVMIPFADLSTSSDVSIAAKTLYDILIGFFPKNLVNSFADFNSVQLLIIGMMFGFSLLLMGQKGESLIEIFDECSMVAFFTNSFINRFIYIYVGLKLFDIITMSRFKVMSSAAVMVIVILAAEVLLLFFFSVRTSRKTGMPLSELVKTLMPSFIICISSANMGASTSTIRETLRELGIHRNLTGVMLSMGSILFQPACTTVFIISSVFMAGVFDMEISAVWILLAVILSIVLVATIPNVPGASVSIFTLMYTQLGLPAGALSLMIAIYAVLQFMTVAVDVWCLQSEMICLARDMEGSVDYID